MTILQTLLQVLPTWLHLYWILAAGAVIVTLLPVPLPQAFKDAVRLSAARGKLWTERPRRLGLLNDMSVPQRWFLHFYIIGTACALLVTLLAGVELGAGNLQHQIGVMEACQYLALWLFSAHLIRRLLETRFMMVYPAGACMHIIAYLFGCSYYIVAPLSLLPHSVLWFAGSGSSRHGPWAFSILNQVATCTWRNGSDIITTSAAISAQSNPLGQGVADPDSLTEVAAQLGEQVGDAAEALAAAAAQGVEVVADKAGDVASIATLVGAVAGSVGGDGIATMVRTVAGSVSSLATAANQVAGTVDRLVTTVDTVVDAWQEQQGADAGQAGVMCDAVLPPAASMPGLLLQAAQQAPQQLADSLRCLLQARHWLALLGSCLMVLGFCVQCHAHLILARLSRAAITQKQQQQQQAQVKDGSGQSQGQHGSAAQPGADVSLDSGAQTYQIPYGGLFSLISCPHYFGEILIYFGLAVLCWPKVLPLLMLLWVVVNLVLAALATQRWYLQHFSKSYPRRRRALIPCIL